MKYLGTAMRTVNKPQKYFFL